MGDDVTEADWTELEEAVERVEAEVDESTVVSISRHTIITLAPALFNLHVLTKHLGPRSCSQAGGRSCK